jgi:hypothetical protein
MGSTPVGGGLVRPLSQFHKYKMFFLVSVFPPCQIKRRAGAFVALDVSVLRAPFQPTSFGRKFRNGRIRGGVIPPRLMMAHELGVTARHKRAECRKMTSALRPNAFRAYFFTDGRQPFVPAASRNASLFRAYPSVPLFRGGTAVRRRSPARRHPAQLEHITNKSRLSRQFARSPDRSNKHDLYVYVDAGLRRRERIGNVRGSRPPRARGFESAPEASAQTEGTVQ